MHSCLHQLSGGPPAPSAYLGLWQRALESLVQGSLGGEGSSSIHIILLYLRVPPSVNGPDWGRDPEVAEEAGADGQQEAGCWRLMAGLLGPEVGRGAPADSAGSQGGDGRGDSQWVTTVREPKLSGSQGLGRW